MPNSTDIYLFLKVNKPYMDTSIHLPAPSSGYFFVLQHLIIKSAREISNIMPFPGETFLTHKEKVISILEKIKSVGERDSDEVLSDINEIYIEYNEKDETLNAEGATEDIILSLGFLLSMFIKENKNKQETLKAIIEPLIQIEKTKNSR